MAYIIGTILVIIALIIVGLILRKRVYDVVDRQESWKLDIMNRNIASELQRIKSLNLSGETQEKFEAWKERWEYIVTRELTDVEELLFEAEEAADKYRFPTARKILRKSGQTLQSIEENIEKILQELDELLESEENSRLEIEHIEPEIKALRKKLSQQRYLYGKAEVRFDVAMDELEEKLAKYHGLTKSGDYYEAQQIVDELKVELESLQQQMAEFPSIYKACTQELPAQLDDLYTGLKGMKEDGYRVEHLGFEKEIHSYQRRLLDCVRSLDKGNSEDAKLIIPEMDERIKEMYVLLEKEAIAKNYMETQIPNYQHLLNELGTSFHETKAEVESLKRAYYFEDGDMEKYLTLDKAISQLNKQLEDLSANMENEKKSHSELRDSLEAGFQQIETLQAEHEEFKNRIRNLRKDELEAKEKLSEMKNQLSNTMRKLNKSNIPGVPTFIWNLSEAASEKNMQVLKALEKQPLDITEVQQTLAEAQRKVDSLMEQTDIMLDQAYLTEQVIQYANRYRSKYPLLAAKLAESERLFRSYEYELSLEQAAKALEEIEPGALKRIEAFQEEVMN
ncbi:septation ring formation regulator EzrA [Lentibacillus populi]|uniref:Septation ring formation regulator EzrA n=1 Tax=Lentibacillus populi TaxID=1827502 RepID=A0A9W5TU45_9BACI|nr:MULTISPECIES: septation ring formation regulator EzrA [Bacillaceae]MBT2216598.1 septation ring formation regulator EzrA [Virgibacillus dakarensis]GGB27309.1 septation ring formation regulator EzrA [Lentibacillus populi]